jgi:hypothetical protein
MAAGKEANKEAWDLGPQWNSWGDVEHLAVTLPTFYRPKRNRWKGKVQANEWNVKPKGMYSALRNKVLARIKGTHESSIL